MVGACPTHLDLRCFGVDISKGLAKSWRVSGAMYLWVRYWICCPMQRPKSTYADTETFFKFGLERSVVPNKFTYNIMIKASVYANGAGAEGFLPYRLQHMIAHRIRPDRYTFNMLFQDLRRNYGASASLLRRTYQRILRMQTSVKILGHVSKEMLLKTVHYESI